MIIIKKQRWLLPLYSLILTTAIGLAGCDSSSGSGDDPMTSTPEPETEPEAETETESETESEPEFQSYEATLDGRQEVPQVRTEQSAMASVTINETDMTVTAEMDLSGVEGVNAARIHEGQVGADGPALFELSDADEDGVWKLEQDSVSQAEHDALLAGNWYVKVHTDRFPDGELRGQILSDTQSIHLFTLSGKQQVPSVQTNAYGHGYLFYDGSDGVVTLNTHAWDFTPTAVHIHQAEAGLNGDVIAGWEVSANDDDVWQLPEGNILGSDEILALYMANLYVSIYTEAHPGGEIRGQILPEDYRLILFDLSPGQEVPRADSTASGAGYATVNTETGGLRLNVWSTDMDAQAAHIHQARIGNNGDAVMALEESSDHPGLWQIPENIGMNSDAQALLLAGGHYVNMHSNAFPEGEIRGQIVPDPWQVVTFELSGAQQVPAVETDAEGDGYALVNTESGNLSMVVNTRNLDTASAAHIHTGDTGANGNVLVELEQDHADASIWRLPADTSLDDATLSEFLNAGHYVNVQSPSHPEGEVRGQIAE